MVCGDILVSFLKDPNSIKKSFAYKLIFHLIIFIFQPVTLASVISSGKDIFNNNGLQK